MLLIILQDPKERKQFANFLKSVAGKCAFQGCGCGGSGGSCGGGSSQGTSAGGAAGASAAAASASVGGHAVFHSAAGEVAKEKMAVIEDQRATLVALRNRVTQGKQREGNLERQLQQETQRRRLLEYKLLSLCVADGMDGSGDGGSSGNGVPKSNLVSLLRGVGATEALTEKQQVHYSAMMQTVGL